MSDYALWRRVIDWLWFAPVVVGFRLIGFVARTGNRGAQDVVLAMWNAGLNVPEPVNHPNYMPANHPVEDQ